MTHEPWAPPEPPAPFSVPPGRSVVIPNEPKQSRNVLPLVVVGLAAAALAGGVFLLTLDSDSGPTTIDSAAVTSAASSSTATSVPPTPTTTPSTTTTYLPQGGVVFLTTRSEISARSLQLDFSHLTAGTCFNVVHELNRDPETVAIDCAEPHYYQLYAIGLIPAVVTDYAEVDDRARRYCHNAFLSFVDHWWYLDSHFTYTWNPPDESEFPASLTNYCFLEVPGDYAWTGDAEDSGA